MTNPIKGRRTTITLEEDVSRAIKDRLKKTPYLREKVLINELLRKGLKEPVWPAKKFKIKPLEATLRKGIALDNIGALLEEIES